MAEYYAVLNKAVAGLQTSTPETRRAVYDKARNALIGQLKAIDPPLPTSEISRQRLELEEAIRRVEREVVTGTAAPPARVVMAVPDEDADEAPAVESEPIRRSPQEIFRRAIRDAETGSAGRSGIERAPQSPRMTPPPTRGDRIEPTPTPSITPSRPSPRGFSENPRPPEEARLAPDYAWDEPQQEEADEAEPATMEPVRPFRAAPEPPYRRFEGDRADDRAARVHADFDEDEGPSGRPRRRSRVPAIILVILILIMAGGLGVLAWTQRTIVSEILTSFDKADTAAPAVVAPPATDAASNKNDDRLLPPGEQPPQRSVRVVGPEPGGAPSDSGTAVATLPPVTAPPATTEPQAPPPLNLAPTDVPAVEKATLYEEPTDPAAAAAGAVAIDASVDWSFVASGPDGPEIVGNITVPSRGMTIKLTIRRNTDASLPASHLVEVLVTTPADFPGKGIDSVPRLMLKPTEGARGDPLIGAAATVAPGFYWIALSGAPTDVTANMGLLRDRDWIDLPLLYQTGQRAIVTIEKGAGGDAAFAQALAAWKAG